MTDNETDNTESSQQPSADHPQPVSKPKRGLLGSSFIVSMGTMLSRVLGLVRDVVLANLLGAAPNADAFFVAFKIPNFLRRLFSEGAFSQAFVPVLTETRERGSHEAVRHLVDRVAGVLGGVLFVLTVLAMVMAPWVALIFAPGFSRDAAKLALTADLIVWTFPYLLLISLSGFCGAILNSYGRFAVPAYTPVLLNHSLIRACTGFGDGSDVGWGCAAAVSATLAAGLKANTAAGLGYQRRGCQKDTGTHGASALWRLRKSDQSLV